jgi:hypothetical protein
MDCFARSRRQPIERHRAPATQQLRCCCGVRHGEPSHRECRQASVHGRSLLQICEHMDLPWPRRTDPRGRADCAHRSGQLDFEGSTTYLWNGNRWQQPRSPRERWPIPLVGRAAEFGRKPALDHARRAASAGRSQRVARPAAWQFGIRRSGPLDKVRPPSSRCHKTANHSSRLD